MAKAIPKGLTRDHVDKALAELDGGVNLPFGDATKYELVVGERRYPPKAVVGLAAKHLLGRVLGPKEFRSGIGSGEAVRVLRELGYEVRDIADTGNDWTAEEVSTIVDAYFAMLRLELQSQPYSKAEYRRRLAPRLRRRSDGSVEFKHQNISAVLVQRGLPYIDGYKPRSNFQALLAGAVDAYMDGHPDYYEALTSGARLNPSEAPVLPKAQVSALFEPPPDRIIVPSDPPKPWLSRRGRKIDFARHDAENRRLGSLGEQWVVDLERRRLLEHGRDDLATKVEWVAKVHGDGVGFDVLSYNPESEKELFIEVNTTALGKYFPFLATANEVRCSEDVPDRYQLYRVFSFSSQARLYVLPGALSATCRLSPALYRAAISSQDLDEELSV